MASLAKQYKVRLKMKATKAGRNRKNKINRDGSTPTKAAFFGDEKQAKS